MSSPCTTKTFTSISSSLYYFSVYDMIFSNNNNRRVLNFELLLHFVKPTHTFGNREFIRLTFKYRESVADVLVVPFYFLPQRGFFFVVVPSFIPYCEDLIHHHTAVTKVCLSVLQLW